MAAKRVDSLAIFRIQTTIEEVSRVDLGTLKKHRNSSWHTYNSSHSGGTGARGYYSNSNSSQGHYNQYPYNYSSGSTRFSYK